MEVSFEWIFEGYEKSSCLQLPDRKKNIISTGT
jgi:hypothetical protein